MSETRMLRKLLARSGSRGVWRVTAGLSWPALLSGHVLGEPLEHRLRPGTVSDSTWTSMPAASISGSRYSVKSGSLRAQFARRRRLDRFAGHGGADGPSVPGWRMLLQQ